MKGSLRAWLGSDSVLGWAFLAPGLGILLLTYVYPLLFSIRLSLSQWDVRDPSSQVEFRGLGAYGTVLKDGAFWTSVGHTAWFTAAALAAELLLGMVIALAVTSPRVASWYGGIVRALLLIPLTLSPVVVGILWRMLFSVQYGPLNYFLSLVGIAPMQWIASPDQALWSAILVEVWQQTAVVALILSSGLLSLPKEPLQAAVVDGASPWYAFRRVTLPQLRPVLLVVVLLRTMDLFKTFDFMYAMTFGGPGVSTEVLSLFIYKKGMKYLEFAQSAASSWVMLLALLPVSLYLLRRALTTPGEGRQ